MLKDIVTLLTLLRRDRREVAAGNAKPAVGADAAAGELRRWRVDVEPLSGAGAEGWRLLRLRRSHRDAPRAFLHSVTLAGPADALLAPRGPSAPDAFFAPDAAKAAKRISIEREMPASSYIDPQTAAIIERDEAVEILFVLIGATDEKRRIELDIDAEEIAGDRRPIVLRLASEPMK